MMSSLENGGLYKCGDSGRRTVVSGTRGGGRTTHVDIHCHAVSPAAAKAAGTPARPEMDPMGHYSSEETRAVNRHQAQLTLPKLISTSERLADMDAMGIDVQVLSPSPGQYFYWAESELGVQLAETVNDHIAEMVASEPDRFAGLGTLPMQHPSAAVEELERCVVELGFRGVELCTNVNGEELSAPQFHPVFSRAQELGVLLFLHPTGFSEGRRLSSHYFNNVIGNPLDTTVALSHLIFDGVLDQYPGLKICAAHGGGFLPSYASRMDHAWCVRPDCRSKAKHMPSSYLKKMYFDTVVFDPENLDFLIHQYGHEHILMGTDYPFDMGDANPLALIEKLAGLDEEAKDAIRGGNARKLLGLPLKPAFRA
ncbi:amidohydrolase [Variovorax paradoxus]|nr:amidohydrolase family protein [Variovorax paradoxus]MBT2305113.1 amidohydrolase [Variovorax paradoxus]